MSIRDLLYSKSVDRNELSAGLAMYQKGMVELVNVKQYRDLDTGELNISALAMVESNLVDVRLLGSHLTGITCFCDDHRDGTHTFCRHAVAVVRALSDKVTPDRQIDEDARKKVVGELLDAYAPPDLDDGNDLRGSISLQPTLDFDPYSQRYALSFRIASSDRSYVLKNLTDFATRVRNQEIHSYGKWLNFRHRRDQFDDNSQFYIDLITSAISLMSYGRQLHLSGLSASVKRYLYLTNAQFDLLFDHVAQNVGHIPCQVGSDEPRDVVLRRDNPQGNLSVTERPDGRYRLAMDIGNWQIYHGDRHNYLYTRDEIIRPDISYQRAVLPLIDALAEGNTNDLVLNEEELATFIATAEPLLRPHVALHIDSTLHERLIPPDLDIHLRLDYPWPNTVRGKVTFRYGKQSFNPLDNEAETPSFRDQKKEKAFTDLLYKLHFSQNEDELLLLGEDALFDLLHDGLEKLMAYATIDIEDRLSNIRPKAAKAPRMNAAMNHGMIELNFDESLYPKEELVRILEAYRENKKFIRLSDDTFLDIVNPVVAQLNAFMEDVGMRPDALMRDEIELPGYRAGRLMELAETGGLGVHVDESLSNLAKRLNRVNAKNTPLPAGLNAELRPYQVTGFNWFVNLSELGMGGILADDMGLGKTLQTIAFLLHRKELAPEATSLIVVPTSLIYNWEEELTRFAPSLPYRIISGHADERRQMLAEEPSGCLLITSYATLRRDAEYYEKMSFDTIIADEAQYIKNSYTQNAQSLKGLTARYRFALTGTPMENALADLWSIMDFCMPGYLHHWTAFKNIFEIPIARYENSERLQRLQRLMTPFLLRRVKSDVLAELPDKIETTLYAELSGEEARIYQSQLALSQKTFLESLSGTNVNRSRIKILALLMRLRQVCCSPALFLDGFNHPSAKLRLALDVIRERLDSGHQLVLFSQFTSMLDLIAIELDELDIPYLMLTGQTRSDERMQLVNRFQNKEVPVFLISLKAGGVGLNLTAADTVIHYDPWWNQSVENQATDRTHRIGQKETVHVIRLICKNTIEEKIMALKAKKAALAEQIVGESKSFLGTLTEDDLRTLFDMMPEGSTL